MLLSLWLAVRYQGDYDAWGFIVSWCRSGYPAAVANLNVSKPTSEKNRTAVMSSVLDALWEDRDVRFDITAQ